MSAMSDLIEDWIQIRSTLQRQLKTLESNQGQSPVDILWPAAGLMDSKLS